MPKHSTVLIYLIIFCSIFAFRIYGLKKTNLQNGQKVKIDYCIKAGDILQDSGNWTNIYGIYVKSSLLQAYNIGDCFSLIGTLEKRVTVFFNKSFYLVNESVLSSHSFSKQRGAKGLVLHTTKHLLEYILYFRRKIQNLYYSSFSAPESQLLAGIVLGTREKFTQSFYRSLTQSGTLHLVAASGMNLTIFIGSLQLFLAKWIGRKKANVISIIFISFYTILSGLQVSIIRAGILLFLYYLAQVLGRKIDYLRLFCLTGGVMLLYSPLWLFSLSFWLSFASSAGLFILAPKIKILTEKAVFLRNRFLSVFALEESFVESLSAYLFTWAILLFAFGQFTPLVLLPNLLILWLVPYLMGIGGVLILVSLF